ncbi:MAG TPA: hypothetical protein P5268_03590 [Candidatus Marinimicrobia bacterium]|nr:hypothetical protein [Candidatus Neomarinimicrobiota bacterium]
MTNNEYHPYPAPALGEIGFSLTKEKAIKVHLAALQEIGYTEVSVYLLPYKLIDELKRIYIYENPQEIKTFLLLNKDLIPVLKEAPDYIYRVFGRVPIYLELHSDPEEGWDELFILIKSSLPAEEAINREKKLFDIWFSRIIHKVGNRLNYTEEPL